MKVLVINSGSSSLKYQLVDTTTQTAIASGLLERIGETSSKSVHQIRGDNGQMHETASDERLTDHREAIRRVSEFLNVFLNAQDSSNHGELLDAIGHRVVHGGEAFTQPTVIDSDVVESLRGQSSLAPLHSPANLMGIEATLAEHPTVPQVAVFDTAFHQTIPSFASRYAVPESVYREHKVRRYGFHGTSYQFVARRAAEHLRRPLESLNLIALHLGNGASVAAIRGGQCIDTSMGLTPLEGLVMGTRCGDIDPAVIFHLHRQAGLSVDELDDLLNKQSGLKGLCGDNDMREILRRAAAGDSQANLAVEMYCYRIKKYIGAYMAALGSLDAIIFTAGVGEHAAEIRAGSCDGMALFGVEIDEVRNAETSSKVREIQTPAARVKILVIPTNEELEIANQTVRAIDASGATV